MYIIIGQGIAGTTSAETLRRMAPQTPVTMITNESDYVYSRIDLPDVIAGKREPASAMLRTAKAFSDAGVTCIMDEPVTAVLPAQKTVELVSGKRLHYHKLLLATGSVPVVPPVQGADSQGVYSLWTMRQAKEIIHASEQSKNAVVVGAGLIGLKTALALKTRGLNVTVIEMQSQVLPRQLDKESSDMLTADLQDRGFEILVNTGVEKITVNNGVVCKVCAGGRIIPAEMVIMAVGVKPNLKLAAAAGIKTSRGITVNEFQQTSLKDIYAAGDVAETVDRLSGDTTIPATWPVAVEQGRVAASNMAGYKTAYDGSVAMNAVEIGSMPLVSIGDIEVCPGDEAFVMKHGGSYRKVLIRDKKVCGVISLGDIRHVGVIGSLISRRINTAEVENLSSSHFSFADLIA